MQMPRERVDRRFALGWRGHSPDAIVVAAQQAEALGYETVWVGTEGRVADADPFVAAAAVLGATSRVRSGPGIVNAVESHPVALARAALTLDRMAPGRAVLGIGRGDPVQLRARLGLHTAVMSHALRDSVSICAPLLRGESITHAGRFWSADVAAAQPADAPGSPIPLAVAAVGERTLRLGGAVAGIVLLNYGASLDYVRWAKAQVEAGALASGRDPAMVEIHGFILVASTDRGEPDTALARVQRTLSALFADPGQAAALSQPHGVVPTTWDEATCALYAAVGSRQQCLARIAAYVDAGLDCAILLPSGMRQLHLHPA
jgi:5,10-methylenetetrahydromethanopterin reductase